MKKALSWVCTFVLVFLLSVIPTEQIYASGLTVSGVPSSAKIGDTFQLKITCPKGISAKIEVTYDPNVISFVSGDNANGGNGLVIVTGGSWGEDIAKTNALTFKAVGTGSTNISVVTKDATDVEGNPISLSGTSASVTVANQAVVDPGKPEKSGDNSLASLKISAGTLSPRFQSNITKYTATVDYEVTSIHVDAKTSHAKASVVSVTGNGTVSLNVGANTIKIVVKAENGTTATYEIVVTRKEQPVVVEPQPSESETTPEAPITGLEEILQWNGEQLQLQQDIPAESIPADFEKTTILVNGKSVQGLSFLKGNLKVLYLVNTNGAGSLYIYDEVQQTIYPFIKLISEKSYVIVLLPDEENAPAPDGFKSCILSIEGKGVINAYQMEMPQEEEPGTEETDNTDSIVSTDNTDSTDNSTSEPDSSTETFYAAESDFYLIYCMNNQGDLGWYLYDSVEGTFQRYLKGMHLADTEADVMDTEDTENTEDTEADAADAEKAELTAAYQKLEAELAAAKTVQYIMIAAAVVLAVAFIILLVILLKRRGKSGDLDGFEIHDAESYNAFEEDEDNRIEQEDVFEEESSIGVDSVAGAVSAEEVVSDENEDDEFEIEFYEMTEESVSAESAVPDEETEDDENRN